MIHRVVPQIVERMQWCVLSGVLLLNVGTLEATPIALHADDVLSSIADLTAGDDYGVAGDGINFRLDYNPVANLGLVELTLSPILPPGALVPGMLYDVDFSTDRFVEDSGGWESDVVAIVTAIPEPGTFALIATGAALLARRRIAMAGSRWRA